ncbi:MAG: NADP-dependent oxidoreductase [Proteobacteria bacterium]|nr:NADP-dependent oxidoreductase [Pseudomonadota bacterium]
MRAVYYEEFGGSDKLQIGDLPDPVPGPGEVLVRIGATSINPIDWKMREGVFECIFDHTFPIVPGWDMAGSVVALGEGADGFAVDDRVFAYTRRTPVKDGTYCELMALPAEMLAPIPENLSIEEAAAVPLCALTAWQSLAGFAGLGEGQTVLVQAGAGGVGSFAIQIAKSLGARVLTTAGPANADYCRSMGADAVIDYRSENPVAALREAAPQGIDVLLDMILDEQDQPMLDRYLALIKEGGTVVTLNMPASEEIVAARNLRSERLFSNPLGSDLATLGELFANGTLKLPDTTIMPLDKAAEAMDISKAGHVRGKIILAV